MGMRPTCHGCAGRVPSDARWKCIHAPKMCSCAADVPSICHGCAAEYATGMQMDMRWFANCLVWTWQKHPADTQRICHGYPMDVLPGHARRLRTCNRCAVDVPPMCSANAMDAPNDLPLICYGGGRICYGYARDVLRHAIDIMAACYACATDALRVCYGCATSYGIPTDVVCICYRTSIAEVAPT